MSVIKMRNVSTEKDPSSALALPDMLEMGTTALRARVGEGKGQRFVFFADACLDKFDRDYQETCGKENWRPHYFLNHETKM